MKISVVICTHNPKPEYLQRALQSLQAQTLAADQWEVLIIDNASTQPVAGRFDLSWHPRPRFIVESMLGLTCARLRGIAEAEGDVLVFIDDDNVLDPAYLEQAEEIARTWPAIGAWGGSVEPEFEKKLEQWMEPWLPYIAIRTVAKRVWTNIPFTYPATPLGAGLCVRKGVAQRYAEIVAHDNIRKNFDRKGSGLGGGGDLDLAFTACDMGLGIGVFPELRLTHIIPAFRLEKKYLHAIYEGSTTTLILLKYVRGEAVELHRECSLLQKFFWEMKLRRTDLEKREFAAAAKRGYWKAVEIIRSENNCQTGWVRRKEPLDYTPTAAS